MPVYACGLPGIEQAVLSGTVISNLIPNNTGREPRHDVDHLRDMLHNTPLTQK